MPDKKRPIEKSVYSAPFLFESLQKSDKAFACDSPPDKPSYFNVVNHSNNHGHSNSQPCTDYIKGTEKQDSASTRPMLASNRFYHP